MPLEYLQELGIIHLSKKPLPMFDHSKDHSKEFIPNIQPEPSFAQLSCHSCMSCHWLQRKRDQHIPLYFLLSPPIPLLPPQAVANNEVTSQLPFLQARQPSIFSLSSWHLPSSPFTSFLALLQMHSSILIFLYCGDQNCTQYSRWGHTNTKWITSFYWLAMLCLMHP